MRHAWSALCRRTSVDAESYALTLNDIVETITMTVPPGTKLPPTSGSSTMPFPMQLVSVWARDDANKAEPATRIRIILKTPRDPQPTVVPELDVDLGAGFIGRTLIKIGDVLWRGTGEYAFHVETQTPKGEWRRVAEVPFLVKVLLEGRPEQAPEKPKAKASAKKAPTKRATKKKRR